MLNIEDTGLFKDIAQVRDSCRDILQSNIVWYHANDHSDSISPDVCNAALMFPHVVTCNSGVVESGAVLPSSFESYYGGDFGILVRGADREGELGLENAVQGEIEIGADFGMNEIFMIDEIDTNNDYDINDEIYLL